MYTATSLKRMVTPVLLFMAAALFLWTTSVCSATAQVLPDKFAMLGDGKEPIPGFIKVVDSVCLDTSKLTVKYKAYYRLYDGGCDQWHTTLLYVGRKYSFFHDMGQHTYSHRLCTLKDMAVRGEITEFSLSPDENGISSYFYTSVLCDTDAEKYRLKVDFPMFNIIYCNEEQFQNRKRNGIFAICTQYCLKKEWIMSIEDASVIVMGKQVKSDEINRLLENKKIKSKCIDKYMNIEMAESIISMIANCADRKTFLRKRNNKYTWKFRAYKEMAETKNMQIAVVGSDTSSKLVFDIITKMRVNTSYYNICNQKYYINGTECGYNMFAKSIFNSDCIIIGDTYKRFVVNKEILETIKDDNVEKILQGHDGVIVPGGFGQRGIEGMIKAAEYARINKIPYLGICLGMQIAVIEFARHVCGLTDASSREFDELCPNPVIDLMADQKAIINKGGTLRLGNYRCHITKGTLAYKDYKSEEILERHRHRYEFNNNYKELMASKGLTISGINPESNLVEIIELEDHPHFIACQFHPEFKSRPTKPHPLFDSFVKASIDKK